MCTFTVLVEAIFLFKEKQLVTLFVENKENGNQVLNSWLIGSFNYL